MKRVALFLLLGLLEVVGSFAQAKPQGHIVSKEQQAAQAAQALAMAKARILKGAKTAALVVRATTTVSCPQGAPGDCIRTDTDIIAQVQNLVDGTELWQYFEKVDATEAEVFLVFEVHNGNVSFNARNADTNEILYSEYREVVSLDNDINRMVVHFLQDKFVDRRN